MVCHTIWYAIPSELVLIHRVQHIGVKLLSTIVMGSQILVCILCIREIVNAYLNGPSLIVWEQSLT